MIQEEIFKERNVQTQKFSANVPFGLSKQSYGEDFKPHISSINVLLLVDGDHSVLK